MYKYKVKKTMLVMSSLLSVFYLGQVHAVDEIMDFGDPLVAGSVMPAQVSNNADQVYSQNGFETTSINFSDPLNLSVSHIHGKVAPDLNVFSRLEADAGGALFRASSGEDFSFKSWDIIEFNMTLIPDGEAALHVVGLNDGIEVASVDLTQNDSGSIDFYSLDKGFGDVDLVEYWFNPPGRGEDPALFAGLNFLQADIDNVTFGDPIPVVPEPETYAMLLVGLGLVGFAANRRRTYH